MQPALHPSQNLVLCIEMGNTTHVRIAGTHLSSHSRSLVIVGGVYVHACPLPIPCIIFSFPP